MFKLRCQLCQRQASRSLCRQCWSQIPPLEDQQSRSLLSLDSKTCFPHIAYTAYQSPLKQILFEVKYQKNKPLAFHLGQYLGEWYAQSFPLPDLILSVPLYSGRLKERGFNQSEELARGISSQINRPAVKLFLRIKDTTPLFDLNPEERRQEISGAFKLTKNADKRLHNKRILLIDDIFTTGTTLKELSGLILPWTKKIIFLTLTRAMIIDPID